MTFGSDAKERRVSYRVELGKLGKYAPPITDSTSEVRHGHLSALMVTCAALFLLAVVRPAVAQVSISGAFRYPDTTGVTGTLKVSLTQSPVTLSCGSTPQVLTFKAIIVKITNGTLGPLSLYPTVCMSPEQKYVVEVKDSKNLLLYRGYWSVPNSGSANTANLDDK